MPDEQPTTTLTDEQLNQLRALDEALKGFEL